MDQESLIFIKLKFGLQPTIADFKFLINEYDSKLALRKWLLKVGINDLGWIGAPQEATTNYLNNYDNNKIIKQGHYI